MRFSADALRACSNNGIPASIENPRLSRIWLCPPIVAIKRLRSFNFYIVDFCMCGTPWKKQLGFSQSV